MIFAPFACLVGSRRFFAIGVASLFLMFIVWLRVIAMPGALCFSIVAGRLPWWRKSVGWFRASRVR